MKKTHLILVASIIAGILAIILVRQQMETAAEKFARGRRAIVRAKEDIPAGEVLGDRIEKAFVDTDVILPNPIFWVEEHMDEIRRQTVARSIPKGQVIFQTDLAVVLRSGLSGMLARGKRALSIPVDAVTGVSGLLEPNCHVDLVFVGTTPPTELEPYEDKLISTLVEDVTVVAVGGRSASPAGMGSGLGGMLPGAMEGGVRGREYSTITVMVTPEEARLIIAAQEKGKIYCLLRCIEDIGQPHPVSAYKLRGNNIITEIGKIRERKQQERK